MDHASVESERLSVIYWDRALEKNYRHIKDIKNNEKQTKNAVQKSDFSKFSGILNI